MKQNLLIIFNFIAISIYSQTKELLIVESETKSIIPFCTIKSVNQEQLSYSDENGKATYRKKF